MRYIGNKTKLLNEIEKLLIDKKIYDDDLSFFDGFSGTASVGSYFKNKYKVSTNDNLFFSFVMSQARLNAPDIMFEKLGFDPFDYFNNHERPCHEGFIFENYSPEKSGRMFFSNENAKMIDFIRTTIDEWYKEEKITEWERYYLIACLIESLSFVANVAGFYSGYLHHWDCRAVKKMVFRRLEITHSTNKTTCYNEDILSIIKKINGDILYLDPPYTKVNYANHYHLLETVARYDNPEIQGKVGVRTDCEKSPFSSSYEVYKAFDELIANANFSHIIVSYSSDGIMSADFIKQVLLRYGIKDTFEMRKISYRNYTSKGALRKDDYFEYLFYIQKKQNITYNSPIHYTGNKADMIEIIKENLPKDIKTFYDVFGGGCNVGINVDCDKVIYNDINEKVKELVEYISTCNVVDLEKYISKTIKKYGLETSNKEGYLALRDRYNKKKDIRDLFILTRYGFQHQIRFNKNLEFNNPCGLSKYDDNIREKLFSFSRIVKEKNIEFHSKDYQDILKNVEKDDFVYLDPPYLITLGSYNESNRAYGGWDERDEKRLLSYLVELNNKGIRFMLSNVLEHKDKENAILKEWIKENNLRIIEYDKGKRKEVLIINY